jgi:hypothetical protein
MKNNSTKLLVGACLVALGGCVSAPSIDATANQSYDGLTPIKGTAMRQVWADEEFDLTRYTKVMLQGSEIHYRPVKGNATSRFRSSASEFPLTEEQKDRLEVVFDEQFEKALREIERYEVVEERGPDVLLVRGTLIDVVSKVPPEGPGRTEYYLDSVGQATFVVEFVDSQSDAVLIRGVDTRAAGSQGPAMASNRVTSTSEVRRLASYWANMLVAGLNELTTFDATILQE